MPNHIQIDDSDGPSTLTFSCGDLPADGAVAAAGHEPNGYFWEGLARYLAPRLTEQLELDPEAGMFAAYGDRSSLEALRTLLGPYLDDGQRVASTIGEAEASGFQFDD